MSLEEELKQFTKEFEKWCIEENLPKMDARIEINEVLRLLRVHTEKIRSWKKFTKVTDKLGKSKLNPEWMKGYSCGYKNAIDQVLAELTTSSTKGEKK